MILKLAEQGRLDLDRPLTDAIPDLRQYDVANAAERRLTFRDCLMHRTFLPAVEPIYTYGDDPAGCGPSSCSANGAQGRRSIRTSISSCSASRSSASPGASLPDWPLGEGWATARPRPRRRDRALPAGAVG